MTYMTTNTTDRNEARGISGLTARQIVAQSQACHPDWDAQMHIEYLMYEEDVNLEALRPLPEDHGDVRATVARWLAENAR